MTIDHMGEFLTAVWHSLSEMMLWLADVILMVASAVTRDHLEGALAMAVLLLGPSLIIGLLTGFWQGLRIEWGQFRERPHVIDGDTIEIRGETIRLFAIDTPELGQPWWREEGEHDDAGRLAKEALEKLVQGRRVSVKVLREGKYRRSIGIVKVDGRDVGRILVSRGWAFASPGSDRYRRAQTSAKRRRKGFWRGELQMPWDYRAAA